MDDVSSESSVEIASDIPYCCFDFEKFLQQTYDYSYLKFEREAQQQRHIVDVYNYNEHNAWQKMYL